MVIIAYKKCTHHFGSELAKFALLVFHFGTSYCTDSGHKRANFRQSTFSFPQSSASSSSQAPAISIFFPFLLKMAFHTALKCID